MFPSLLLLRRRLRLPSASLPRFLSHRSSRARPSRSKPSSSPRPPKAPPPPPAPPKPPPKRPSPNGDDPYAWMSALGDRVSMRHMDAFMEEEDRYLDAVMAPTFRLRSLLQSEMSVRMALPLSSPPVRWGPWLYYRRAQEGKPLPLLCRRSAALHGEFLSLSSPSEGFDFETGRRIEQVLLDYNREQERAGGEVLHGNRRNQLYTWLVLYANS